MNYSLIIILGLIPAIASPQAEAMTSHCIFSTNEQESSSASGTASTTSSSGQSDLSKYPDKYLRSIPTNPVSPRFVVQHRSWLNGKTILVRGIVVRASTAPVVNPGSREQAMANPQPRIYLADTARKSRDKNYDVMVLLREGDGGFIVGRTVKLKVTVDSSKSAIALRKEY